MFNRTQTMGRYLELVTLFQRVRQQGNILQVRQERALGLVVGVADIVAYQTALAGEFANARHDIYPVKKDVVRNHCPAKVAAPNLPGPKGQVADIAKCANVG